MTKKLFILILLLGFAITLQAQTDKVYMHNGQTLEVSVKSIANGRITYSYPGETITMEVSENQVEKIIFSSGRTQQISEKIIVKDEDDWEKVMITSLESDIQGLVKKGEVAGSKTGSSLSNTAKIREKAEREMKEEAAEMGAHIIFYP